MTPRCQSPSPQKFKKRFYFDARISENVFGGVVNFKFLLLFIELISPQNSQKFPQTAPVTL